MIIVLSEKKFAEKFKNQFTCLGESTGKYITFIVPTEKEVTRTDINREEITKNISYILQFIDSAGSMASSLSNLVNKLYFLSMIFKEFVELNVNTNMRMKNAKLVELNIRIATVFFNKKILKMI